MLNISINGSNRPMFEPIQIESNHMLMRNSLWKTIKPGIERWDWSIHRSRWVVNILVALVRFKTKIIIQPIWLSTVGQLLIEYCFLFSYWIWFLFFFLRFVSLFFPFMLYSFSFGFVLRSLATYVRPTMDYKTFFFCLSVSLCSR